MSTKDTIKIADPKLRRDASILVRWRGSTAAGPKLDGGRPASVEVLVLLDVESEQRVSIEAWLTDPAGRRRLLDRRSADSTVCAVGRFLHVDAREGDERLLAVTMDVDSGRLVYARTPLLAATGLPAGAFDPPVAERLDRARGAATA